MASLIQHNLANPGRRLVAAAIQYDKNPNALIVKADSPIRQPRDFIGKRIAGQPFNASRALFPIFARAQGIPAGSVQWQSVDPGLGNQLFLRGEVNAVAFFTGLINLQAASLPLERMRSFVYADYGLQGGLRQRHRGEPALRRREPARPLRLHPRQHAGLAGLRKGPPEAGDRAVKAREALADQALETARVRMIAEGTMVTPDTRANGWGTATPARLAATIEETKLAFGLTGELAPEDIFTDRFLAPTADRVVRA